MCGRYASFLPPELIARLFGTRNSLPNLKPTWNMAPTMDAPVVRRHPETGERHLDALTWGFIPATTKTLKEARRPINARAETVVTSGMFGHAFAKRRCIVPAQAFYEWQAGVSGKTPYAIARVDGDPLAFAGIWEGWRIWLGEQPGDARTLLRPSPEDVLRLWQVDKRVGNVRNDGPDLLTPVENDHEAFVLHGQQESGSAL
jgi:putative SOS response-associated peptidase YedK